MAKPIHLWLPVLGLLAAVSSTFAAGEVNFSFYDPSRPGRHVSPSLTIPQSPKEGGEPIRIHTLFDYPGTPSTAKPTLTLAFNGKPLTTARLQWSPKGTWVKIRVEVPAREFVFKEGGGDNEITLSARLANGTVIERKLTARGVPFPRQELPNITASVFSEEDGNFSLGYRVPPQPIRFGKDFPLVGKYGLELQLTGKLIFYPLAHRYNSETLGGAKLTLGERDYNAELGSKEESQWEESHWVKKESRAYLGLSTSFTLWEKSFYSLLPPEGSKVIETIPFLGLQLKKTLQEIKVELSATPALYGELDLKLLPTDPDVRSFTFGGEVDLSLTASAIVEILGVGKFGIDGTAGGKIGLECKAPANQLLQSASAELYLKANFYFACFESGINVVLLKASYNAPTPPPRSLLSMPEQPLAFTLVPAPAAGEQVEFPLAPLPKAMPRGSTPGAAAAKARFRQMDSPRLTPQNLALPMGPAGQIAPASTRPAVEAGAIVPVAVNTTSVAWPAFASHDTRGGMLALFGVDKRKPGSGEKSAQFTQLLWTYYKDGNWTTPAPVPAGNGAAQISPSVAVLSAERLDYIAGWEQLEDPKFEGKELGPWLNQTQVVLGVFQAEDAKGNKINQWTSQTFGTPGRADLAPKLVGQFSRQLQDNGMAVWVSAKIPENPKAATLLEDAEFRGAICLKGKWGTLPLKGPWPKVPKGLLSWDIAASDNGLVLVYSEDIGNGQSRIMLTSCNLAANHVDFTWQHSPLVISDVPGVNLNPKVIVGSAVSGAKATSQVSIIWNEGGKLVTNTLSSLSQKKEKEVLRPASDGVPPDVKVSEFRIMRADDPPMAITWTDQTPQGQCLVVTVFDPISRHWCKPLPLTTEEGQDSLYATSTDAAGNLVLLYVHTGMETGTVQAKDAEGRTVSIENARTPGRETIMVGKFRPTRDLAFDEDRGLSTNAASFASGKTVKLTARVRSVGMLGFSSVSVAFYHGNPAKGGTLIAEKRSTEGLKGGDFVDVTAEWKLPEGIWDREESPLEVYAVIKKPDGVAEWNPDNNTTLLHVDDIVLRARATAAQADRDGSATVAVTVHNTGYPYAAPVPVEIYDYSGSRKIASEVLPRVDAGGSATVNVELPKGTIQGPGGDFLVKVDPENSLKLYGSPKVETRLHIPSAPAH